MSLIILGDQSPVALRRSTSDNPTILRANLFDDRKTDYSSENSSPASSPVITPSELVLKIEPFPPSPTVESGLSKSIEQLKVEEENIEIKEESPEQEVEPIIPPIENNDPCIVEAKLIGGPFHTSVLSVNYVYKGGKEGPTMFEWQASKIANGPDESFQVILGATKSKLFPSVDHTAQEIRVIITPVRDDWVEGKPFKTNSLSIVLGKDVNIIKFNN